jgi:hypothetical protein
MKYHDLERHFGRSPSKIARGLGMSPQRVSYWRANGIPLPVQALIQLRTNGALRADRHVLL